MIFEYLAAANPILVLGTETEAARIVADAAGGIVAEADDREAIAAALRRLLEGGAPVADPEAVERYSYPRLARAMAAEIERAIAQRGRVAQVTDRRVEADGRHR